MATYRFNMVLPSWLRDAVKQAADRKGVSMSEWVKDALKAAVERESSNAG